MVPENGMEELIDHWHNARLMHPGRDKMQQDLKWRFSFPPGLLRHPGQVLQLLRRVLGHEEPQPLHGWQPGVYVYTACPYAVCGHGCIRHARGHRGRRDL